MSEIAWCHLHLPRLRANETDCISVKIPGRPICYRSHIALRNARFVVHEPGRQRCIRENVRNVHAWVVGEPVTLPLCFKIDESMPRAIYDPFKSDSFCDAETLTPLDKSDIVYLVGKHVYYVRSS